jgi:hypothetical protein
MPAKKRTRSPDRRKSSDRPGSRMELRLNLDTTAKLSEMAAGTTRTNVIVEALEEKYLRFCRGK